MLKQSVDSTIYELHVRDFSISDPTVPAAHRGSYLAFADDGDGTKHLRALASAGLNTVHLLPTFDIATIEEDRTKQATTSAGCDLASLPPDSEQQQACINGIRATDGFNWGYDPFHWLAPEGSYASTAAAADGGSRVAEFRTMVGALHQDGLRVVLDQVFNHTPASGEAPTSVLDQVVPGYYQRLDKTGAVYTSTCCQNVATEHAMAQKIMVDAVVTWARDYKVDGFRFDLMGHASKANMLAVRAALDALTLRKDGVDGKSIYLYGEGWNFGEVAEQRAVHPGQPGQPRRHRHRDVQRPDARRRPRWRAVRRRPAQAGLRLGRGDRLQRRPFNARRRRLAGARHRPGAARAGRQPAGVHLHRHRGRDGSWRPGRLQRSAGRATPTSRTR